MILQNGNKVIDLQLFAGEKTEKATLKKRRDARERGQVFRSVEVNSAIVLLAAFASLKIIFPTIMNSIMEAYVGFFNGSISINQVYSYEGLRKLGIDISRILITNIGPFMLIVMAAGLVSNYVQVGFLFTTKTITPELSRINPLEGFKRIFSKRSLVELVKSIIKLAIIGSVVYTEIINNFEKLHLWYSADIIKSVYMILDNAYNIAIKIAIILLVFSVFDFAYQWWQYELDLMMTKQEVKDEYKLMEGDPQIRSRIRSKQRELGMRRMMQEVAHADVVITNPVHYAVALRYDPDRDNAPVVVAKGKDYVALKIKEIAQENDIIITENKPLAHALYNSTDIGQEIPPELFQAVAEVLAFVFELKGKTL
ncbi:MAG: flagellar biosynthesis protein FlhB [Caldicoprobacterales bacterium]